MQPSYHNRTKFIYIYNSDELLHVVGNVLVIGEKKSDKNNLVLYNRAKMRHDEHFPVSNWSKNHSYEATFKFLLVHN